MRACNKSQLEQKAMCRLNKFTATLYVNENIKEQGSGGIVGTFGAQDSETISSDGETKPKYNCSSGGVPHYPEGALMEREQFYNSHTYDHVESAFVSLPRYFVSVHSRRG